MNPLDFHARLNAIVPAEDGGHLHALAALADDAHDLADQYETASAIFAYLERHHAADLGSPGPLVHYLETAFPSYVEALLASLARRPVSLTLWMANRILNVQILPEMQTRLLLSLRQAVAHPCASKADRDQAREFLDRQSGMISL